LWLRTKMRRSKRMEMFMRHKKIYLAGPMTGYKHFNFPKFDAMAYRLDKEGWDVFSPAANDRELLGKPKGWIPQLSDTNIEIGEIGYAKGGNRQLWQAWHTEKYDLPLREMLAHDLAWICKEADAIAMLPGWERSRGACAEHATAVCLGLEVQYLG
jgi:hypothetical protein